MFVLTSDIKIEKIHVKANKITWKTDVNTFVDTCTIDLPKKTYLVNTPPTDGNEKVNQKSTLEQYQFKVGELVEVSVGYDKRNYKRFTGFIKSINMGVPVRIECEGYVHQLQKVFLNKSYSTTTIRQILTDLTTGTDIVLSKEIPDVPLKNIRFKGESGIDVLNWIKNECRLMVYFNLNELYVGTMYGKVQKRAKVRIGWNTIKDDDLKQKNVTNKVNYTINHRNEKGEVKKVDSLKKGQNLKSNTTKQTASAINRSEKINVELPKEYLAEIGYRSEMKENYSGYEGNLELFLEPFVWKGMVLVVDGGKQPEKAGEYFIEAVSGEFGDKGGRQTVTLGCIMQK